MGCGCGCGTERAKTKLSSSFEPHLQKRNHCKEEYDRQQCPVGVRTPCIGGSEKQLYQGGDFNGHNEGKQLQHGGVGKLLSSCCKPVLKNPCLEEYSKPQHDDRRNLCIGDYEKHMFEPLDEDICDKGPRNPHQIPGYTGHVPTMQSRSGKTYGQDTHQVLSTTTDQKPPFYTKRGHVCPTPLHQPYHIPGYTGHVPGLQYMVGGNYGQDTHKLLYTDQPYPNRQENISPYRPTMEQLNGGTVRNENNNEDNIYRKPNGHSFNAALKNVEHSEKSAQESTYQKPYDHFHQPQFKYRIGDTYATTADLTLIDPCVNQKKKVVVSTRELDDTQVVRAQNALEERVQEFPYINQPVRHRPMVPGFDAYIDAMRGARGQRFEFTSQSPSHKSLQQQLILQKGKAKQEQRVDDNPDGSKPHQQSFGLFNPAGETPYGYERYGNNQPRYTNSALHDFTSNYRRRQSTEWAPATISRPDPPAFDIPGEIYSQHIGLLPGYSAHVPGALFRCGKTFTDDSRDARRALTGDRF